MFAIVMTLLVIEIHVPDGPSTQLGHELTDLAPTLLTYALSFTVLGVLWFGHRAQFEYIQRVDHPLIWLNLTFLGVVALIPFSAALLANYDHARLAVFVYGIHLTLASLTHGVSWTYATLRPGVLLDTVSPHFRRVSRIAALLPAVGYLLATAIGAFVPIAGLIGYLLVPLPFISGTYYRRLAAPT